MGMAFMPPRVVSWAYQRGQRSLLQNLAGVSTEAMPASMAPVETTKGEDDVWVPDELEDIVEQLLVGLRDR
jgi:hypothetical protein